MGRWLLPWSWLAQDLRGELDSKVEQARLLSWWHWLNFLKLLYSGRKKNIVSSISSVMFLTLHEPLFSNPIRDDYVRMTAVLGWFETTSQILSVECGWQLIEMKHYHSATCSQPGYEVGHGFCPFNLISQPHSTENLFGRFSLVDFFLPAKPQWWRRNKAQAHKTCPTKSECGNNSTSMLVTPSRNCHPSL